MMIIELAVQKQILLKSMQLLGQIMDIRFAALPIHLFVQILRFLLDYQYAVV